MRAKILLAVFLGGSIGSALRYLTFVGIEGFSLTEPERAIVATTIVNLLGSLFLGFVQAGSFEKSSAWFSFWTTGVAGGFTTMSGLTLVTNGQNLGAFGNGAIFWSAVTLQLILGVLAYWFGRQLHGLSSGNDPSGAKP